MGCFGNILWFICGGFVSGLGWCLAGCLWCITIVGIPVGIQCFKFASLSFWPFGKEVRYGGGAGSMLLNIIWLIVTGLPMAAGDVYKRQPISVCRKITAVQKNVAVIHRKILVKPYI